MEQSNLSRLEQAYLAGRKQAGADGRIPLSEKESLRLYCENFDAVRFLAAARELLRAHPMLHCGFDPERGTRRELWPSVSIEFLRAENEEELDLFRARLRERFFRPQEYHPTDSPLSFTVLEHPNGGADLYTLTDGLVMDGRSQQLLVRDLNRAYAGERLEKDIPFSDYLAAAAEEREAFLDEARAYWAVEAEKLYPAPELYLADSLNAPSFQLEQPILPVSDVFAVARALRVTPFALLLSVYLQVLERYADTGETGGFTLNLPVSVRPPELPGAENLIGLCADFTLFSHRTVPAESFSELALRVQRRLASLMDNLALSGVELLRLCSSAKAERFSVPYTFTFLPDEPETGAAFSPEQMLVQTGSVTLEAITVVIGGRLQLILSCDGNKIRPELAQGIAALFAQTLRELVRDPYVFAVQRYDAWPLCPRDQALIESARGEICREELPTLSSLLRKSLSRADKPALLTGEGSISYSEMAALAGKLQGRLRRLSADGEEEPRIGILLSKGVWQIISAVACGCGGYVFLPLEAGQPPESVQYTIEKAGLTLLITENKYRKTLRALGVRRLVTVEEAGLAASGELVFRDLPVDGEVMMINTSGSTGRPKSIRIGQRGLVRCLIHTARLFGIDENDTSIAVTNFCHDMAMFDALAMIAYHGSVAVLDTTGEKDPKQWISLMNRYHVTVWSSVPAFMEMLFASEAPGLREAVGGLKRVMLGGDWVRPGLMGAIRSMSPDARLFSVGGPSETTVWNIFHEVTAEDLTADFIPYGKPFPNTAYYILDGRLRPCPALVSGTMFVSGEGVALGYAGLPDETEKRFRVIDGKRMYDTGDRGLLMTDGNIRILGRSDFQVKINGKRIELSGIENVMKLCPGVLMCAVVVGSNGRLVAYYTADRELGTDVLDAHLRAYLAPYMIPRMLVRLAEMPLTANAKPDRAALAVLSRMSASTDSAVIPDAFAVQRQTDVPAQTGPALSETLLAICRRILQADTLSPDENFYYMGGDSISAMKLVAEIRRVFGVELEVYDVMNQPYIADWEKLILSARGNPAGDSIPARPSPERQALDEILTCVLGSTDAGEDNFFRLGGDERTAAAAARAISARFAAAINEYELLALPFLTAWEKLIKERTLK